MNDGEKAAPFFAPARLVGKTPLAGELPTTGEAYGTMFQIAWPATLEAVAVSLVTLVDTVMVGWMGTNKLASVSITNQPRLLVLVVFMALNVGITAIVARRKGENDPASANSCVRQGMFLAFFGCVALASLAAWFAPELIRFMGARPEIVPDAVLYYRVVMLGLPLTTVSLAINAGQRGAGNTRISLRTNLTANLVNAFFNYLLITGKLGAPALGVLGAAIATDIGYFVAMCMSIYSLCNPKGFLYVRLGEGFFPQGETLRVLARVGGNAAIEQVVLRIGYMGFVKIVASLGTAQLASYQICMNIMTVSCSYGDGLGIAAASLVGQNLGKKRPDLAAIFGKVGQYLALFGSVFIVCILAFGARPILLLFSRDPEVIDYGVKTLYLLALMTPPQMVQFMYAGCLRGAGDTRFVALASLLSTTLTRPLLGALCCFVLGWGVVGAWVGILGDQLVRLTVTYWRFQQGNWQKIKV